MMQWESTFGPLAGILGGLTGLVSLFLSLLKWRKVNKKLGMLSDASKIAEVLPAWYTERMTRDDWLFGLLMRDGRTILIRHIVGVSTDKRWMDVELVPISEFPENIASDTNRPIGAIADDRTRASIQVSAIVAALDLQTS